MATESLSEAEDLLRKDGSDIAVMNQDELRQLLARTDAVLAGVQDLRTDVQRRLHDINVVRSATNGQVRMSSYTESHPGDTLEALGLPAHLCDWFGHKGLGIRSVKLQLVTYSRQQLADQLDLQSTRRGFLDPNAERLMMHDIIGMLDAVEKALTEKGLKLAE